MVCSCAMSSNCVWLKCLAANNFPLMRKRHYSFLILLLAIALAWKMAESFASRRYSLKNKLGDRVIKQFLNSVIAKYRDLSVSRRSIIIFLSLRLVQIIGLLATDKSRYFARWEDTIRYITQSEYHRCTCDFIPWSTYRFRRHIWTRVKRCFDSVIIPRNEWNIEEYPCFRGCAVYVEMWCSTAVGWRCIPESLQMGKLLRRGDWDQVFQSLSVNLFKSSLYWPGLLYTL